MQTGLSFPFAGYSSSWHCAQLWMHWKSELTSGNSSLDDDQLNPFAFHPAQSQ
jgi:hypothetical protein